MNAIEEHNLNEMMDQYMEEVVKEHGDKICMKEKCVTCAKSKVVGAIWDYLEIARNIKDVALF
jgi:hypothetical protein